MIYLASPFFDSRERFYMTEVLKVLRDRGEEVYAPYEHKIEDGEDMPNEVWGALVYQEDINAIQKCDEVYVIYDGMYSDSGTAFEVGYARAIGKPITAIYTTECRKSSLMIANAIDKAYPFGYFITPTFMRGEYDRIHKMIEQQ